MAELAEQMEGLSGADISVLVLYTIRVCMTFLRFLSWGNFNFFSYLCVCVYIHTHTHTHIYIYIYTVLYIPYIVQLTPRKLSAERNGAGAEATAGGHPTC